MGRKHPVFPYPFTIADVMARGAKLAADRQNQELAELAALPKRSGTAERATRAVRDRRTCVYCGRRNCEEHNDLPSVPEVMLCESTMKELEL